MFLCCKGKNYFVPLQEFWSYAEILEKLGSDYRRGGHFAAAGAPFYSFANECHAAFGVALRAGRACCLYYLQEKTQLVGHSYLIVLAYFVVLIGFEPIQAEPESDVLPLHHRTIFAAFKGFALKRCKITTFFLITK